MLANPVELASVTFDSTWFSPELSELVIEIEKRRAGSDCRNGDRPWRIFPSAELVQRLAFDPRPLPAPIDVVQRAEVKAFERQIKYLEGELEDTRSEQWCLFRKAARADRFAGTEAEAE